MALVGISRGRAWPQRNTGANWPALALDGERFLKTLGYPASSPDACQSVGYAAAVWQMQNWTPAELGERIAVSGVRDPSGEPASLRPQSEIASRVAAHTGRLHDYLREYIERDLPAIAKKRRKEATEGEHESEADSAVNPDQGFPQDPPEQRERTPTRTRNLGLVRVAPEELEGWRAHAKRKGQTLSRLIRQSVKETVELDRALATHKPWEKRHDGE